MTTGRINQVTVLREEGTEGEPSIPTLRRSQSRWLGTREFFSIFQTEVNQMVLIYKNTRFSSPKEQWISFQRQRRPRCDPRDHTEAPSWVKREFSLFLFVLLVFCPVKNASLPEQTDRFSAEAEVHYSSIELDSIRFLIPYNQESILRCPWMWSFNREQETNLNRTSAPSTLALVCLA